MSAERICIPMQVLMILHQGIRVVVYNNNNKNIKKVFSSNKLGTVFNFIAARMDESYLCGILIRFTKEFLPFCCSGVKCYE